MSALSVLLALSILAAAGKPAPDLVDVFKHGEVIELDRAIPANERGILCLARAADGHIYGGSTGRAAHLFVHDPRTNTVRSLARLDGGIGFAHGLLLMPDGSLIGGTQADPTGAAIRTDAAAVGHLYRFTLLDREAAKREDLGVPVSGQGIYTLAYLQDADEIVGNTWPDGHFFSYQRKNGKFTDHGAVAGYHPFETPRHAEDVGRGTGRRVSYPRQVSRAIAVDPASGAYTAGADGYLYHYDPRAQKLKKLALRLPAAVGREPWTSLDAAVVFPGTSGEVGDFTTILGGTSEGHLFELRLFGGDKFQLRPRGKPLAEGTIQGLAAMPAGLQGNAHTVLGVGGGSDGMPRAFRFSQGGQSSAVIPGGIPDAGGQVSMVGFGALLSDDKGTLYAGERDRIGRLVRYRMAPDDKPAPPGKPVLQKPTDCAPAVESLHKLPCQVVFAPEGTTTEGSGYTALEVGQDGRVYVGAARYGDYGWLLRFDPAARPLFMDRVVNLQQLTGEHLQGVNTQAKIHAKILVGADGKIWFASKQGHEIFDSRPEYGAAEGYPGGHLCYFDPQTGFSRSLGILKKQEGLLGGALDDARGKLYYRSGPRNHFLVYDVRTGDVQDRGHVGAACRYMARDRAGAVYTVGRGATLCRYDPATGYVEDLAVKVEGEGAYAPPYAIVLGPNGKLYGAGIAHPWIMEFDIDRIKTGAFPEVTMHNVAPAVPGGMTVQDIHAAVFGKDGRLYYPAVVNGPLEKGGKPEAHLRILRFDPATKKTETVGIPDTSSVEEERVKNTFPRKNKYRLMHIQGAAVGADGTLFLMGIYPQLNVACFARLTAP